MEAWQRTLTPEDIRRENAFRTAQRKAGKSRRWNIKDPNAPKKPLSAYFVFLHHIRSDVGRIRDVFGDERETTAQSVLAAQKWRSMTDEERKVSKILSLFFLLLSYRPLIAFVFLFLVLVYLDIIHWLLLGTACSHLSCLNAAVYRSGRTGEALLRGSTSAIRRGKSRYWIGYELRPVPRRIWQRSRSERDDI